MHKNANIKCSNSKVVDVDSLIPNPKNPNKHPEKQIKLLAKIIKHQGQRLPIVVSKRSGFIVAGHGRLEAIKSLGWPQCAIDEQDFATEADEYAHMIADNKIAELAEHDNAKMIQDLKDMNFNLDLDLLGMLDFKLPEDPVEPQCDEDEIPEQVETRCKRGDIWQLGNHRLMCGDSTMVDDVERLMSGEMAELCFTSPPYSDQREYNGGKELSTEYLSKFISTAKKSVNYFSINLGYSRKKGEVNPYWDEYIKEAKNCGLKLLSWNIWNKLECGSIGNQTAMFGISHEWIFVFGEKPKDLNRTIENISAGHNANHKGHRMPDGSIKKGKDRIVGSHSQLKTVYDCVPQKSRDDIDHPARFPVQFPQGYIESMTDLNQIVYEPFGGSGSTLIACEKTGRKCFIMELDEKYCDVILTRWEKYTGKLASKLNG